MHLRLKKKTTKTARNLEKVTEKMEQMEMDVMNRILIQIQRVTLPYEEEKEICTNVQTLGIARKQWEIYHRVLL